jgi:hypothetical protein
MGFRRAIVPAGASGSASPLTGASDEPAKAGTSTRLGGAGRPAKPTASGGIEVVEVDNVAAAVQAALMD